MTDKSKRAVLFGINDECQLMSGALTVSPGDKGAEMSIEEAQVLALRDIAFQLKKLHEKLDNVADAVSSRVRN